MELNLSSKKKQWVFAYAMLLPYVVVYTIVKIYPFFYSLVLTFFKWDIIQDPVFIGFKNYAKLLTDEKFWMSMRNILHFTALTAVPAILLGLITALIISSDIRGKGIWRVIFFLPYIFSVSVVSLLWLLMYGPKYGLFNMLFVKMGLPPVEWLTTVNMAFFSVSIATLWWGLGFNFLIYLAALQQIPKDFYEAASIDGARWYHRIWYLTIPLLKRTTLTVAILQLIASLKSFGQIYLITGKGAPGGKSKVILHYIYEKGFLELKMGYAQTAAFIFFLMVFAVSLIQLKISQSVEDK